MYLATTLATALALMIYQGTAIKVGKAREQFGIKAPATSGNEQFERIYRVQMNTLEQIVVFLPSLWMFAFFVNDKFAGLLGLVWSIGRIIYAKGYYGDAAKRHNGFIISFFAAIILLIGSVIGALLQG